MRREQERNTVQTCKCCVVYFCMCSILIARFSALMGGFPVPATEGACSQPYVSCLSSSLTRRLSVNWPGSSCGAIQLGMCAIFVPHHQSQHMLCMYLGICILTGMCTMTIRGIRGSKVEIWYYLGKFFNCPGSNEDYT